MWKLKHRVHGKFSGENRLLASFYTVFESNHDLTDLDLHMKLVDEVNRVRDFKRLGEKKLNIISV